MRIIIDNDYSRQFYSNDKWKNGKEKRRRGKRIFILVCSYFFEVEFIARYIFTRNHDNIIISNLCVQHPNGLM